MRKYVLFFFVALFFSCEKNDEKNDGLIENSDPMKPQEINSYIDSKLDPEEGFDWANASDYVIWSAIKNGNGIVSIGYGENEDDFEKNDSFKSNKIKKEILTIINQFEEKNDSILIYDDQFINQIDVRIDNIETVKLLRKQQNIRYFEPDGYNYFEHCKTTENKAGGLPLGCDSTPDVIDNSDYTIVPPNSKVPWTFYEHNIPQAWNHSTGSGITVAVVDTGLSPNQPLMNSDFNDGYSNGRTVQKYGVYVDSFWPWATTTDGVDDKCGHGTKMMSTATAPRNNDGLAVGVAYNSNLVAYRAAANVLLGSYQEKKGVKNAFIALGNRSDVKIISMSMGHIFSIGKVKDGVKYAYKRGKLIFCAGGTSTRFTNWVGVIFPARMKETVAVTGIKDGQRTKPETCDICHKGKKIDFTIVMERTGTKKNAPVLGYNSFEEDYVGGSSVATATTAGIAALVWAKHPTWNRDQVLNKLKQSANFYPNKDRKFGYGNIDALQAVQ
ncbi:S8 family peptidase [Flavobacterium sp.]|uniref:S8 family peptidase n=1 Tax=Flavobacterium sp. TaxID=239 RepID=UPI0040479852